MPQHFYRENANSNPDRLPLRERGTFDLDQGNVFIKSDEVGYATCVMCQRKVENSRSARVRHLSTVGHKRALEKR